MMVEKISWESETALNMISNPKKIALAVILSGNWSLFLIWLGESVVPISWDVEKAVGLWLSQETRLKYSMSWRTLKILETTDFS